MGLGREVSTRNGASAGVDVDRVAAEVLAESVETVRKLGVRDRVVLSQRYQREFAAIEAQALAELKASGVSQREVERNSTAGGTCLLYTSPSPRDATLSRMPSSA